MKKLLSLLVFALAAVTAVWAAPTTVEIEGIYYELTTQPEMNSAKVVKHPSGGSYSGAMNIPATVGYNGQTYSVDSIAGFAFQNSSITSLYIPASVYSIENAITYGCNNLTSIVVDAANVTYDSRNDCNAIIRKNSSTMIAACVNTVIPSTVSGLGFDCFAALDGLTEIDVPESVRSLSWQVFMDCSNLKKVTFHEGLETLNPNIFMGCTSLETLTLPSTVRYIGQYILSACTAFKTLTCLMPEPPAVGQNDLFGNISAEDMTLRVPKASLSLYKNEEPWSRFGTIESIEGGDAEDDEAIIKSTFTGIDYFWHNEMSSEGAFTTAEGNNWDVYSDARNPYWPRIEMDTFDGEDCIKIVPTNQSRWIVFTSQFEIKSTIKEVIVRAGGNLGSIELRGTINGTGINVGVSDTLVTYTLNPNNDFELPDNRLIIGFCYNVPGEYVGGVTQRPEPYYIQSITIVCEGTQGETVSKDVTSTFQYCLDDKTLVAEEEGCDWSIFNNTEGNSIHAYDTSINYKEQLYKCIVAELSGSEEVTVMDIVSAYSVKDKVKRIVVEATGNIVSMSTVVPGYQVNAELQPSDGPFNEWVMDFGEGFEPSETMPLWFRVEAKQLFFIRSITVEFEVIGGEDDGLSGISGDLAWKAEKLDYQVGYWGDNGYEEIQAYRLTFSGNGNMGDYDSEYSNGQITVNTPWADLKGITEVVIGEGALNIGTYALAEMRNLETVTLPTTLKYISYDAFSSSGVSSINLPEGLERIDGYAFSWCGSLGHINIPASVTVLSNTAFVGNGLESITVAEDNPLYYSPEGSNAVIRKADNVLYIGTPASVIPANVTAIGNYAFYNNYNVSYMPIPEGVELIGEYAFAYSGNFTSVVLPHSVTTIGKSAFNGCRRLSSITIGKGVITIGQDAFLDCVAVDSVLCYANPDNLTWTGSNNSRNFKPNKGTLFIVRAADLEKWEAVFEGMNVTFVGELPNAEADPITEETTVDVATEAKPGQAVVTGNGVVISLGENDIVDTEDGSVTITSTMTNDELTSLLEQAVPGSSAFDQAFKGIYFLLAAGKGYVEIDCQTLGDYQLTVKQGDNELSNYTKDTPGSIRVQYNSENDEWILIFPTVKAAAARAKAARHLPIEGGLKIYNVKIVPEEVVTGIESIGTEAAHSANKLYNMNGQQITAPQKGIYIVRQTEGRTQKQNSRKVMVK